jgi:hypothetical protein
MTKIEEITMTEIEEIEKNERQRKKASRSNRRVNCVANVLYIFFEFLGQFLS